MNRCSSLRVLPRLSISLTSLRLHCIGLAVFPLLLLGLRILLCRYQRGEHTLAYDVEFAGSTRRRAAVGSGAVGRLSAEGFDFGLAVILR